MYLSLPQRTEGDTAKIDRISLYEIETGRCSMSRIHSDSFAAVWRRFDKGGTVMIQSFKTPDGPGWVAVWIDESGQRCASWGVGNFRLELHRRLLEGSRRAL